MQKSQAVSSANATRRAATAAKSRPIELDLATLKQVSGGITATRTVISAQTLGPHGGWAATTTAAFGPHGGWQ